MNRRCCCRRRWSDERAIHDTTRNAPMKLSIFQTIGNEKLCGKMCDISCFVYKFHPISLSRLTTAQFIIKSADLSKITALLIITILYFRITQQSTARDKQISFSENRIIGQKEKNYDLFVYLMRCVTQAVYMIEAKFKKKR